MSIRFIRNSSHRAHHFTLSSHNCLMIEISENLFSDDCPGKSKWCKLGYDAVQSEDGARPAPCTTDGTSKSSSWIYQSFWTNYDVLG